MLIKRNIRFFLVISKGFLEIAYVCTQQHTNSSFVQNYIFEQKFHLFKNIFDLYLREYYIL